MPVTLAQARLLTQDKLARQVIDEFRADALLGSMLFDDNAAYSGGSTLNYVYNRVNTMRSASFREINTEYTAEHADTKLVTATLKPLGGTFALDRVIAAYVHGVTDQVTFQMGQLIAATRAKFSDAFINGDVAVDSKSFDGLDKAIAGSTTEVIPTSAIDLSSSAAIDTNWKVFLDTLRRAVAKLDGTSTMIIVNRETYSVFQSIADRAASFTIGRNEIGNETLQWNGIPLVVLGDKPASSDPIISIEGDGTTSLYLARIGIDGVHAISPEGGAGISTWMPDFTNVEAVQLGGTEMVTAMALKATRAAGVLRKIKVS